MKKSIVLGALLAGIQALGEPAVGYMLDVSRNKVPTMASLYRIADVLSELGYNQFQLYTEHTFAYRGYENVWRDASPMTPEEVRALDAYCAKKGIELVPNQNSFGHLEKWLSWPECRPLAEAPRGGVKFWGRTRDYPCAVCPTDPKAMDFIRGLYDQLLPNFRSKLFNIGCDEVIELRSEGRGRSWDVVRKTSCEAVWLGFFRQLCAELEKRGRTAMFWDDMIVRRHPELIPELPGNAIALEWGYEINTGRDAAIFERDCANLEKNGRRFYVCPGTSGWNAMTGRHFNMKTNVDEAVSAGLRHGAEGFLMCDWGNGGMCQPWIAALPSLVYMRAKVDGRTLTDEEIAARIDRLTGCRCGKALIRYQNLYLLSGTPKPDNRNTLYWFMSCQGRAKELTDERLESVFAELAAARKDLDLTGAPAWVKDGFATMDLLCETLRLRWKGEDGRIAREIPPKYRALWLKHNRPGGLDDSVRQNFGPPPIRPEDWGNARWVWPQSLGSPTNTVVEFRTTFVSPAEGATTLKIAADTVYAVRLNGGEMRTGRFPDVPPLRFYDTLAMGRAHAGTNELTVSLYVQGVGSFQHIAGDPGLMFVLSGERTLAASGESLDWRVSRRHRAAGVPLVTTQLGFSFDYDAAAGDDAWRPLSPDDCRREPADFELRHRPVPPVDVLPPVTERVVGQGVLDGSAAPAKLATGMDATAMRPVPAERFFEADGRSVRKEHFADGFYLLVDLGREEAGLLQLEAETDAGVVIDIGHAEHAQDGRIQAAIGNRCFAGRYWTVNGKNVFCRWEKRMAGRYLQLHVRGVRTRFRFGRLTVRPTEFPLVERPMPAGLDPFRQEIWKTSVRTLRLCMHEHYEDCPWREQALYGNDSRNQMLAGYFAFDSSNKMPELSLELLSRGLDEKGWIELCMPAKIGLAIPSFTLSWVMALGDYLDHRRNLDFLRTMMPALRKVMDARADELVDGLLPCPHGKRYWQFYDWEKDLSGDLSRTLAGEGGPTSNVYEAPLNLFAVLAFESAVRCAEAVGEASDAARWRQAADAIRSAVRRKFWNAAKQQFETRLGASLAPAELSQALGLLANAVPEESRAGVVRKLSAPSDWTKTSLSQSLYKYEALRLAGGEAEQAMLKTMDATWSTMLKKGATSFWEVIEGWKAFYNAGSLCHGWSAIPVYFYRNSL